LEPATLNLKPGTRNSEPELEPPSGQRIQKTFISRTSMLGEKSTLNYVAFMSIV
jgi:hypothetical protein